MTAMGFGEGALQAFEIERPTNHALVPNSHDWIDPVLQLNFIQQFRYFDPVNVRE